MAAAVTPSAATTTEPPLPFFDASKGYFNNKIVLEWAVNADKLPDVQGYEIFRKKESENYSLIASLNNANTSRYEDTSVDANLIYNYLIRAIGNCNSTPVVSDSLSTNGFRYNTGIVTGKVTFAGGNTVEDVEVRIASEETSTSNSLYFDGVGAHLKSAKFADNNTFENPISFDALIRPKSMESGSRNIIYAANRGLIYLAWKPGRGSKSNSGVGHSTYARQLVPPCLQL